jgi:hypothetical protein
MTGEKKQLALAEGVEARTGLAAWPDRSPLGFDAGDGNLYRYVGNAPTSRVDPTGTKHIGRNGYGSWELAQTNTDGTATTDYRSHVHITFEPNPWMDDATAIAFVQVLRCIDTTTRKNVVFEPERLARITPRGFRLDRVKDKKLPWYGYDNDGTPGPLVVEGSALGGRTVVDAELDDTPQWNRPNSEWDFETVTIAKEGYDAGKIYGAIDWGFTVDANRHVTSHVATFSDWPSSDWIDAVWMWNKQTDFWWNRNADDQRKLGALYNPHYGTIPNDRDPASFRDIGGPRYKRRY